MVRQFLKIGVGDIFSNFAIRVTKYISYRFYLYHIYGVSVDYTILRRFLTVNKCTRHISN